jgi:TetR/AcrR family transcriptional repressor of nem operon
MQTTNGITPTPLVHNSKFRLLETACDLISRSSYGAVSVERLCQASRVKKGTFYYFFKSKADLAAASLEHTWQKMRLHYEQIFNRQRPPLERLDHYFEYIIKVQSDNQRRCGYAVGSVYTSIGCEVSSQEEIIRHKVSEINTQKRAYIASAIADAQAAGLLNDSVPTQILARELYALLLGLMLISRIHNDMTPILNMHKSAYQLLGLPRPTNLGAWGKV